jgi:hypothetical protein
MSRKPLLKHDAPSSGLKYSNTPCFSDILMPLEMQSPVILFFSSVLTTLMKWSLNFTGQAEYAEEFIKFENPPAPRVLTNPWVWREAFRLHDGGQAKSRKSPCLPTQA